MGWREGETQKERERQRQRDRQIEREACDRQHAEKKHSNSQDQWHQLVSERGLLSR